MDRPDLLDDPRLTAIGLLFEVAHGVGDLLAPQLTAAGLATSEFEVLMRLSRSPGGALRMTDLAGQAALSTSGLTRLVDRLEHRGLVARQACPTDRRGLLATITPAGRELVLDMLPEHLALIDTWYTGRLSATQLDALLSALRVVREAVRPEATAGSDGDHVPV